MGRTIPSWRMVVEAELAKWSRFAQFLRSEDKVIFQDLVNQCRIYASYASTMASAIPDVPLLVSMLFSHHKRMTDFEKRLVILETDRPRN